MSQLNVRNGHGLDATLIKWHFGWCLAGSERKPPLAARSSVSFCRWVGRGARVPALERFAPRERLGLQITSLNSALDPM